MTNDPSAASTPALQLNLHFHSLTLDGVCVRAPDGRLSLRKVVPSTEDVGQVVAWIADRVEAFEMRWLQRVQSARGRLGESERKGPAGKGVPVHSAPAPRDGTGDTTQRPLTRGSTQPSKNPDRATWAELPKRAFGKDGWNCDRCDKPMKLRALVVNPPPTTRIVRGLNPPSLADAATGPPTP